jgi:hypothetical protein
MDKNKWPNLTLSKDSPLEGLTQEDALMTDQVQGNAFSNLGSTARVPVETSEKRGGLISTEDDEDIMDSLSNLSKDSDIE